ncbi:uncharacterized protein LOC144878339 [Branchiostoma floridae x Branchiostoma japonicum]
MQRSRVTCRAAAVSVLGLLWVVTAAVTCPETCDCGSDGKVNCSGRGLTVVPANIPLGTTVLYLSSNNIQNLSDVDFSNLTSLERLDLDNNDIRVLPDRVFSHLTRLQYLLLYDNHIADLPDGVFSNLTSLLQLHLHNNNISSLPTGVFSHLTSLYRLFLSDNHIADLPDGVFSHLTRLWILDLSNNHIADLPDGVFSHLTSLQQLYLSGNHIADLPDGVFSNRTSLKWLYLSNNNISSLPTGVFSHLTSLRGLWLSDNHIADLPDGVFSHLTRLERLSLSGNHIADLPDGVFSKLTSLGWLYLRNNNISSLPSGVFSHLTRLRRFLDLAGGPNGVLYLYIAGNPWRCDCSLYGLLTSARLRTSITDGPTCSSPPHMEGDALLSVVSDKVCQSRGDCTTGGAESTCACNVGWTGPFCGKENNFALGKKASQSSTRVFSGVSYGAEKAVDGSSYIGPGNADCAATNPEQQPWWQVDLAGYYRVIRVRVIGGFYVGTLMVRVGPNEDFTQNGQCGQTYAVGSALEFETELEADCDPPMYGRYVSVQAIRPVGENTTGLGLGLCEVEVYVTDICCDYIIGVTNGKITATDGYCSGNDIQFSCDPGYELAGRPSATCLKDGSWDGEIPTCQHICCDRNISSILNGKITATDGYCSGNDIQFSCDPGYELAGRPSATCQNNGSWDGEVPTCQRACCNKTISILNGQITASNGFCSGNSIQFSCDTGYELVGSSFAVCQQDKHWDREIPTCRRICCDNTTEIINGLVNATDGYCFGNDIQFSCNPGYELVGRSSATCEGDGSWGRELPTCQLPTEQSPTPIQAISPTEQGLTSTQAIIGGTSAGIATALIVAAVCFVVFLRRRRRKRREEDPQTIELDFLPDIVAIHRRMMEEMVPPIPPRPQFPKLEVDPSRVTLGQRIGSGAFGLVYRATLTRDDRTEDVVVKTVKENACEDDKLGFLEEIRAVVDLGVHKNLLGMINCCTVVRDHLYLITEFMPYGDLKSFLRKCREEENSDEPRDDIYNFEVMQMYQVARQVARGMDHIARSRYVHGDLAARNVLVGERLKVKISDFGLAEDIYNRGYHRQDRLRKIPLKWMAPERLEGGEAYTAQSDVWSFGIVLYEICTLGGDPYPGVAVNHLKDRLQAGYRMPQPEDCPDAMYDLMLQCWRWQPVLRPSFRSLKDKIDKNLAFYGPEYARTAQPSTGIPPSTDPRATVQPSTGIPPPAEPSTTAQPSTDILPSTDPSTTDQPSTGIPPSTDPSTTDQPSTGIPSSTDLSTTTQPSTGIPPSTDPRATVQPSTGIPPPAEPSTTAQPSTGIPPSTDPSTTAQPSTGIPPSTDPSTTAQPLTGIPPSTDQSTSDQRSTGIPPSTDPSTLQQP